MNISLDAEPHPLAGLLTTKQLASSIKVVREESRERQHVVLAISGAHAYGFPSPDSDVDIKGVHLADTRSLLGLNVQKSAFDRLQFVDDVEIDYTSNELGTVVAGIIKGNGNYIERVLGLHLLIAADLLAELRELAQGAINRRVYHHYRGFAHNQMGIFEKAQQPEVKKALYVLRTTLTGAHLLRSGELVVDVRGLLDDYGFGEAAPLIDAKSRGERITLDEAAAAHWQRELKRAFQTLEDAYASTQLPDEAPNAAVLGQWLIDARVRQLRA